MLKNFPKSYLQIWHAALKIFTSRVVGRKSAKNVGFKVCQITSRLGAPNY